MAAELNHDLDLSDLLKIKPHKAKCLWSIGREELSVLPYANEAAKGDLVAVVRTFTTDPRPGVIINDTHEPAFCILGEGGEFILEDYAMISPDMRRIAGPIDTSQRTDPSLKSWVKKQLKARCPNIKEYSETFEAFSLRDAVILHDLDYQGMSMGQTPHEMTERILARIDVVFPEDLSHHALIRAIAGVQEIISDTLFVWVGLRHGLSREQTRVTLAPF